jgi:uncharacterized SAM-binding protein YcdF (DUF218 family)
MLAVCLLYSRVYAFLPKPKNCGFILVLGAGLKNQNTVTPLLAKRLDRGIKYYEKNGRKPIFVVSGGKGPDEQVSEACAMKRYLLEKGIPEEKIITEDKSVNTYENMLFSKKIMEEINPNYTCIIATSNYHVLRSVILAKSVGLPAHGIGGKTAWYYLPAAFIREYIAIIFQYKKLLAFYVLGIVLLQLLAIVF